MLDGRDIKKISWVTTDNIPLMFGLKTGFPELQCVLRPTSQDINEVKDCNNQEDKMVQLKEVNVYFLSNEIAPFLDTESLHFCFGCEYLDDNPGLLEECKMVGKRINEYYFMKMQNRLGITDHWGRNLFGGS